jgi:hypothetical protein
MNKQPLSDFLKYVAKEIEPAVADLGSLAEKNRIHVQKLVYTNLVDRFDTMIDTAILENCREEGFMNSSLKDLTGTVTESELIKLLIHGNDIQGALDIKLKNSLRNSVLRQRHSQKLTTLFSVFLPGVNSVGLQRVNLPNGRIFEKVTPQKNIKTPCSISGYADWVYSRRNSIVHGGGSNNFLENDKKQLKKIYKKEPAKTFKVKLASVNITLTFYKDVVDMLNA